MTSQRRPTAPSVPATGLFRLSRARARNPLKSAHWTLTDALRQAAPGRRVDTITNANNILRQISALRGRLAALDRERSEIAEQLGALERTQTEQARQPTSAGVTMASSTAAKIALFRSLFRGREDVLPRRWENRKTQKAGYAPMCRNEWVRGVCGKPQVKCGECPN